MSTRALHEGDFENLMKMVHFLRFESKEWDHVEPDAEYVRANLHQLWDAGLLFGVVDEADRGCMVGVITNTWFSRNLEATEQMLFVYPPYRGSSVAMRLIKAFEVAAKNKNAEILHVGISTGLNEERTAKLYTKLGFEHKGLTLYKRLT